jgi:hypothetical protein
VIEAIDLTARRRGRTFLDAVGFDVRPGQVTGVLGAAGAKPFCCAAWCNSNAATDAHSSTDARIGR